MRGLGKANAVRAGLGWAAAGAPGCWRAGTLGLLL